MFIVIFPEDNPNIELATSLAKVAQEGNVKVAVEANGGGRKTIAALIRAGLQNVMTHEESVERLSQAFGNIRAK